jgi:hypothetical protein
MPRGVPVGSRNDNVEAALNGIGDRNHLVPTRHSQSPAWHEVVLQIYKNQCVHEVTPQRHVSTSHANILSVMDNM